MWENRSVPEHDPLENDNRLRYHLRNQIRPADIVVVPAGMYAARSYWVEWEMEFSRRIGLPIIGVYPRGSLRSPKIVQEASREMVGWSMKSIVRAIRANALRSRS